MTLKEFCEQAKNDIDSFEDNWKLNNDVDPSSWPMESGIGDWYEQFYSYYMNDDHE